MQLSEQFSGPVSEGYHDDLWSVGGIELNRPIADLVRDLADAHNHLLNGQEVAFAADLWLDPHDGGFHPTLVGSVGGSVATLTDTLPVDALAEDPAYHQRFTLRGEVVWDPLRDQFLCGTTPVEGEILSRVAILLGPYAGAAAAVNLSVVLTMEESTGYDDAAAAERPVTAALHTSETGTTLRLTGPADQLATHGVGLDETLRGVDHA